MRHKQYWLAVLLVGKTVFAEVGTVPQLASPAATFGVDYTQFGKESSKPPEPLPPDPELEAIYGPGVFSLGDSKVFDSYSGFPSGDIYSGGSGPIDLYQPYESQDLSSPYLLVPTFDDKPNKKAADDEGLPFGFSTSRSFENQNEP